MLWRLFLAVKNVERFLQRHVKHTDLSRGCEVSDAAALVRIQGINMRMRDELLRVGKSEQATGKIRPGIALQFENDRFGAALDPDFAAHVSLHAVINFAARHAVMNAKSHVQIMRQTGTGHNIFVAEFVVGQ